MEITYNPRMCLLTPPVREVWIVNSGLTGSDILLPEWKHTESGMELFPWNAMLYSWSKEKEAV